MNRHVWTTRQIQRARRSFGVTERLSQSSERIPHQGQSHQIMVEAAEDIQPNNVGSCYLLKGLFPNTLNMAAFNRERDEDGNDIEYLVWNPGRQLIETGDEFPAAWTLSVGSRGHWVAQSYFEEAAVTVKSDMYYCRIRSTQPSGYPISDGSQTIYGVSLYPLTTSVNPRTSSGFDTLAVWEWEVQNFASAGTYWIKLGAPVYATTRKWDLTYKWEIIMVPDRYITTSKTDASTPWEIHPSLIP